MSVQVGNGFSIGSMGMLVTSSGDTTPPSPEPTGTLNVTTAGDVVVTLTNTGEAGCTRHLERRVQDTGDYASVASTTTVASGTTLTDSGPSAATYDYRLVDIDAAGNRTQHGTDFGPVVISDGTSQASAIKAAIKTILLSAGTTSSTTHARRRKPIGQSTATQQSLFEVGGVVDCWEIEEETLGSTWAGVNVAWHHTPDTYVIRSWRQWDDANNSIDSHRATVEGVIDALNADITLGGTVNRHDTVQVRRHGELEMKAGRLCSVVELVIDCYATRKP